MCDWAVTANATQENLQMVLRKHHRSIELSLSGRWEQSTRHRYDAMQCDLIEQPYRSGFTVRDARQKAGPWRGYGYGYGGYGW